VNTGAVGMKAREGGAQRVGRGEVGDLGLRRGAPWVQTFGKQRLNAEADGRGEKGEGG
jgi:hypothetical protein